MDLSDKELRKKLAKELGRPETIKERLDIAREHFQAGLPIYIGSKEFLGLIVEIRPDGRRTLGTIQNRKFISCEPESEEEN